MAKLPYTYTICPPGPEPIRFTASCREMGKLLAESSDGNLTKNETREMWGRSNRAPRTITIEEGVRELAKNRLGNETR